MATIANEYDPNNPNGANTGGSGTVMPAASGGSSGGGGDAGGGAGGAPSPGASATPYQPPNVSQYLAANQGGGQQLTEGITNNVQNQANQVNTGVDSAKASSDAAYQPLNQNLGQGGQQTIQTAFKDPQALLDSYNAAKTNSSSQPLTSDQQSQADQYNQFQQLNSGGYNQAIQNFGNTGQQQAGNLQNQYSNFSQNVGNANNEMGRNQLLQHAVGQGNYNQGEQTLDSLFLQNGPGQAGGLSNLQQLQSNLGNITGQTNQAVQGYGQDVQSKLAALQGMSAQDQSGIQNLFLNGNGQGTGLNQIGANVQNEYNTAQQNYNDTTSGFANAFKTGNYNQDQLDALGLSKGEQTWGLTGDQISQAAGYHTNALNPFQNGGASQIATPEEYARYNALNQLAGGPNGLQTSIFGSAQQAAGQQPFQAYGLGAGQKGIEDAINQNKQLYGITKVNDIIDQMRQSGYFNGMSSGSGMRSADPGAPYRQASGAALTNLENSSKGPKAIASPDSYYNQVVQALQNSWAGTGVDIMHSGGLDNTLSDYAKQLSQIQGQRINTAGGLPKGAHGPVVMNPGMGDIKIQS